MAAHILHFNHPLLAQQLNIHSQWSNTKLLSIYYLVGDKIHCLCFIWNEARPVIQLSVCSADILPRTFRSQLQLFQTIQKIVSFQHNVNIFIAIVYFCSSDGVAVYLPLCAIKVLQHYLVDG